VTATDAVWTSDSGSMFGAGVFAAFAPAAPGGPVQRNDAIATLCKSSAPPAASFSRPPCLWLRCCSLGVFAVGLAYRAVRLAVQRKELR